MKVWPDGSFYRGYWKDDLMNGRGRMIRSNGDVLEGEWLEGQARGLAWLNRIDGGSKYIGFMLNDL